MYKHTSCFLIILVLCYLSLYRCIVLTSLQSKDVVHGNEFSSSHQLLNSDGKDEIRTSSIGASLIHRYSFTTNYSNVVVDSVGGTDFNGELFNSAYISDGKVHFDDVNQFVKLPNTLLDSLKAVTIEAWVYAGENSGNAKVFQFGSSDDTCPYILCSRRQLFSSLYCSICSDDGKQYVNVVSYVVFDNSWHYIALVCSEFSDTMRLYINGELTGELPMNGIPIPHSSDQALYSLSRENDGLLGLFDEFRIWDGALSDDEVRVNYNLGPNASMINFISSYPTISPTTPKYCCPPGFHAYNDGDYCYYFSSSKKRFTDIRSECSKNGGYIVSINTANEQSVFDVAWSAYFNSCLLWKGFIGYTDSITEGIWLWEDGSGTGNYTNWVEYDTNMDCACIIENGDWIDCSCEEKNTYTCEASRVPCSISTTVKCPAGFSLYGGHCYQVQSNPYNYITAQSYCNSLGGYLVAVHDDDENSYLVEAVRDALGCESTNGVYIGFSDSDSDGVWMWDNDVEPQSDYTNFEVGIDLKNGNAAIMMEDGLWEIEKVNHQKGYVCEITPLTSVPSSQPSIHWPPHPTVLPSSFLWSMDPTFTPSALPSSRPSEMLSIIAIESCRQGLRIFVSVADVEPILCSAYETNTTIPLSKTAVLVEEHYAMSGVVHISALYPFTWYNVYCTSASDIYTYEYMLQTMKRAQTLCCKEILFSFSSTQYPALLITENALILTGNSRPSNFVVVSVSAVRVDGNMSTELFYPFFPPNVTLTSQDWSEPRYFDLNRPVAGDYELVVDFSGDSANEFEAVFQQTTLSVYEVNSEPPIPKLLSATFSTTGELLEIVFDSATDRGRQSLPFSCDTLFAFRGAKYASCEWLSDKYVAVRYRDVESTDDLIVVGDTIGVNCCLIRAKCTYSNAECGNWSTMDALTVNTTPPVVLIPPNVAVSAPSTLGICQPLILDLTASVGDGGRHWGSLTVNINYSPGSGQVNGSAVVNDIESFFKNSYEISPPTELSSDKLEAGSYSFFIRLCNFLGACGNATYYLHVLSEPLPTVSIIGAHTRRIISVRSLNLKAQAFFAPCSWNNNTMGSSLVYTWSVWENDLLTTLTSISPDHMKFKLSPYSMQVGSVYRFDVLVNAFNTNYVSSASVYVTVESGRIVPIISGSSYQTVKLGDSLILSGGKSYDQDAPGISHLNFLWSCNRQQPVLSSHCGAELYTTESGELQIHVSNSNEVGTMLKITLQISDSSRKSETHVFVTILPSSSARIVVQNSDENVVKVNPQSEIAILGVVEVNSTVTASWRSDDGLDLSGLSLTSIDKQLHPGVNDMNLVIASRSLMSKMSAYSFTLQCENNAVTILVSMNTPPAPGIFKINPSSGYEMSTSFVLSASQYTDDDLLLSYEFGFRTDYDIFLVVHGRSEKTYTSSYFPSGKNSSLWRVTCSANVYDSLDAFSRTSADIYVYPFSTDLSYEFDNGIETDTIRETISVSSVIVNSVPCFNSPNCSELNRFPCTLVAHTCGKCLDSYVGTERDDNTECIPTQDVSQLGGSCSNNIECSAWESCIDQQCVRETIHCANNCSSHGKCTFVNNDSGMTIDICLLGDPTCTTQCICDLGYSGLACEHTSASSIVISDTVTAMLDALNQLVQIDDPTQDSITSWSDLQSSVVINSYAIGEAGNVVSRNVSDVVLSKSANYNLFYRDIWSVMDAIDSATSSHGLYPQNSTSSLTLLDKMINIVLSDMLVGQESVYAIKETYRLVTQKVLLNDENLTLSVPRTDLEAAVVSIPSTCTIISGQNELSVSLLSLQSKLYNLSLVSNVLRLSIKGEVNVTIASPVIFSIQYNDFVNITISENPISFTTECNRNEVATYYYSCENNTGHDIVHYCNGSDLVQTSVCPQRALIPRCKVLNRASVRCETLSYSSHNATCFCTTDREIVPRSDERRLDAFQDSGVMEVGVITSTELKKAEDTVITARNFDSESDVEYSLHVVLLFGIMWAIGFFAIAVIIWNSKSTQAEISFDTLTAMCKSLKREDSCSKDEIYDILLAYVNSVCPEVFRCGSSLSKLSKELLRHHRCFLVFSNLGDNSVNIKVLSVLYVLTIQSMLMFLLAVLYDTEFPDDNGECKNYTTEEDCTEATLPYDMSRSMCSWKRHDSSVHEEDGSSRCVYSDPELTIEVVVLFSVVVAMFTAPMNLFVDFLFELLSSPTQESLHQEEFDRNGFVNRLTRRLSATARRLSNAASSATQSLTNAISSHFNRQSSGTFISLRSSKHLPPRVQESHILATAASKNIIPSIRQTNDGFISRRKIERQQSLVEVGDRSDYIPVLSCAKNTIDSMQAVEGDEAAVELLFAELMVDIVDQRKLLQKHLLEAFDSKWRINAHCEFLSSDPVMSYRYMCCQNITNKQCEEEVIKSELLYVKKATEEKSASLVNASSAHIGMEIIQLFCLDILGRDTVVAKIFKNKSEYDFSNRWIVNKWVQVLSWVVVILINLFFVFFSMLRGLERGKRWQKMFVTACLIQIAVEILFFETSECCIIQYVIPSLAKNEVQIVLTALRRTISSACGNDDEYIGEIVLDAPRYFFVSTGVAMAYPHTFESSIVRSFRSYFPGEIGYKWNTTHALPITGRYSLYSRTERFSLTAAAIFSLQWIGALPPPLQRLVVRSLQPIVVALVLTVWVILRDNPLYIGVVAFVGALVIAYYIVKYSLARTPADEHIIQNSSEVSFLHSSDPSDCVNSPLSKMAASRLHHDVESGCEMMHNDNSRSVHNDDRDCSSAESSAMESRSHEGNESYSELKCSVSACEDSTDVRDEETTWHNNPQKDNVVSSSSEVVCEKCVSDARVADVELERTGSDVQKRFEKFKFTQRRSMESMLTRSSKRGSSLGG